MQIFMSLLNYTYLGELSWLQDVYQTLPPILYTILAVVGGAGSVYAIVLGVNLAKSESDDKRKAAASRMKNTIIGVVILLILILFINLALPEILKTVYPDLVKPDNYLDTNNASLNFNFINLINHIKLIC